MPSCNKCGKKISWMEITKREGTRGMHPVETPYIEVSHCLKADRLRGDEMMLCGFTSDGTFHYGIYPPRISENEILLRIRESHFATCQYKPRSR